MGVVHVWLGAAVGSSAPDAASAVAAGLVSHAVGDMVPHRDGPPLLDSFASLLSLGYISARFGLASRQMLGAAAGVAPDVEHLARYAGHSLTKQPLFPTHNGRLPHPESGTRVSQLVCGAIAVFCVLRAAKRESGQGKGRDE